VVIYYTSKSDLYPLLKKADFFDRVISNGLKGNLKSIDGLALKGMFRVPKYYRQRLSGTNKVSRVKNPKSFKMVSIRHT